MVFLLGVPDLADAMVATGTEADGVIETAGTGRRSRSADPIRWELARHSAGHAMERRASARNTSGFSDWGGASPQSSRAALPFPPDCERVRAFSRHARKGRGPVVSKGSGGATASRDRCDTGVPQLEGTRGRFDQCFWLCRPKALPRSPEKRGHTASAGYVRRGAVEPGFRVGMRIWSLSDAQAANRHPSSPSRPRPPQKAASWAHGAQAHNVP